MKLEEYLKSDIAGEFDCKFIYNLKKILKEGKTVPADRAKWEDGSPANTIAIPNLVTEYDFIEGLPYTLLRKSNVVGSIMELIWIWFRKDNNVNNLHLKIWDQWADENGSIGKAYGYQLGRKIQFPEGEMDQVEWLLKTLKENPTSRRMVVNMFNHDDLKDMALQPCAYSITVNVIGGELHMILNQRSQDFMVANYWNVLQYAYLQRSLARYAGLKIGKFTHVIANCHIYDRHIPIAEEILKNDINIEARYVNIDIPTVVFKGSNNIEIEEYGLRIVGEETIVYSDERYDEIFSILNEYTHPTIIRGYGWKPNVYRLPVAK
jgi:thymidylate synthase